jgi:hypothetical protein
LKLIFLTFQGTKGKMELMRTLPEESQVVENSRAEVPRMLATPLRYRMESSDQEICGGTSDLRLISSYDSLSSLSSFESESSINADQANARKGCSVASSPRSIFKTYWDKSGSLRQSSDKTCSTRSTSSESCSARDEASTVSAANSYERVLKRNEGVKSNTRRSIFGIQQESMPFQLPARPYQASPLKQRAKSAPEMKKDRLPSCLRMNDERRTRSSSVSFDAKVSIVTFNPPKENWAADGWSTWFH